MRPAEYRSHGVPLESYELTRTDHRRQADAARTAAYVREVVAAWPPLSPEQISNVGRILRAARSERQDYEQMRWRLRLFCGHLVESTRHCEVEVPTAAGSSAMRCPECGLDPAVIVGYQPLGLVAEPPKAAPRAAARRPARRRSPEQERISELEQEIACLRARLGEPDLEATGDLDSAD